MTTTTPSGLSRMQPLVSIVIPVYNAEPYLRECLESVMGQTLQEIEIIAVNDGSQDASLGILREYAARDARLVVLDQDNQGAGKSRNNGMAAASGEFVAFMDPDDWYPDRDILESLYTAAKQHGVNICGGSMSAWRNGEVVLEFTGMLKPYTFEQDGRMRYRDYQFDYGFSRFIYDLAMLRDHRICFPPYRRFQDPPFFVAAMICADEFYHLKKITYRYRQCHVELSWTPEKANDLVRGLADNLSISKKHHLARLHHLTYSRMVAPWLFKKVLGFMNQDNPDLSRIWIEAIGNLDFALLQEVDPALQASHVIAQFYESVRQLGLEGNARPAKAGPSGKPVSDARVDRLCQVLDGMGVQGGSDERLSREPFAALAFICDDPSFAHACAAVVSAVRHKSAASRYAIYIVDAGLCERNRQAMLSFRNADGISVTIIDHPDGVSAVADRERNAAGLDPSGRRRLKLQLARWLPDCERILLIENETLVRKDLCPVFATQLGDAVAGAVPDYGRILGEMRADGSYECRYDEAVVLLDLQALRGRPDAASALAGGSGDNESLLNRVAALTGGAIRPLPLIFNLADAALFADPGLRILGRIHSHGGRTCQTLKELMDDAHVVNYVYTLKPWDTVAAMHSDEWWQNYYASPCRQGSAPASGHPKVSLIVPVYNVEPYLRNCMDSAINQTLEDIEIICVDDGSTDGSGALLDAYAAMDRRIVIVKKMNGGLSSARNAGIDAARGEYLYFMDSDDYIDLDAMEKLHAEAVRSDLDVIYFDGDAFYENESLEDSHSRYATYYRRKTEYGEITSGARLFSQMRRNEDYKPSACLQFIKRSYLQRIGLSFVEGILYEDNPFSLRCILQADRVRHVGQAYFHRRVRPDSIMTQAVEFKHFSGRYACVINMLEFLSEQKYEEAVLAEAVKEVLAIFQNLASTYLALPEAGKSEADALIGGDDFFRRVAPAFPGSMAWALALAVHGYRLRIQGLKAQRKADIQRLRARQTKEIRKLKARRAEEIRQLKSKMESVRRTYERSFSWRITAPIRALFVRLNVLVKRGRSLF